MSADTRRRITLGVIADDFTGATDVASMLVRGGMKTVQVVGVPQGGAPEADAVVVALKSRTAPAVEAVRDALAALHWLQDAGARQFYFKVCSTFDSTAKGNIGPVTEALQQALDSDFSIACPAFPENGRTVFRGHLFVGDELLSESSMRHHPLTPMTDANLVRVLQAQSRGKVGLVRHEVVVRGAAALRAAFEQLRAAQVRLAVVDAIDNDHLRHIAQACDGLLLLTAGSGVALGLPAVYQAHGWLQPDAKAAELAEVGGAAAVLSGSCSAATNAQVSHWLDAGRPAWRIDARDLAAGAPAAEQGLAWARERLAQGPVLIYATAQPHEVRDIQSELGAELAGHLVEQCLAHIAQGLVDAGVRRLVVAGGETSGAVVQALGVNQLRIGAPIDPGVPWTQAEGRPLQLALKSGNFGAVDFFVKALELSR
ncbi:four-carbon acid sugar kinase family protein [Schlegelella sp. S2-27]|uniref:3-oxo-tetronate kinase n=1 Tax=Caldimonas mangrovi TaxID=2944811 RepID=A0ABT0YPY0_9BURK|nr:four-carbon acid sugar kinase family protein [Caldimonas mangrovi]